jgi:UDP-N-acetylmuramoyl-L-alanyl-D-glutamate--2,6-diaminopimelate ligase
VKDLPRVPVSAVAASVPGSAIRGGASTTLAEVAFDSRDVPPDALFFCVRGEHVDGHALAADALRAGAAALVVERWLDLDAPQVLVPSVRLAMGPMAAEIFGHPAAAITLVGVTGTNGKTTVVHVLDAIFHAAGHAATGVVGTVGTRIAGEPVPVERTTPEAPDLHRLLARMRDAGVSAAAIEVSSHALDQDRVGGLVFDAAVFTNLSQDHLDYHGSMEAYFEAKASLFVPERTEHAVIGIDDPWGKQLLDTGVPVTTYGLDPGADIRATEVRATPDGVAFHVLDRAATSTLRGSFNVSNCLAAIATSTVLGIDPDAAIRGVMDAAQVPGRMEAIAAGQDFLAVVDYAHTPDSIRTVLAAARPLATGRVIVVFGCGGDRDRAKRFPMGAAATEGADLTVITADNPRSEDPLAIIAEVERGAAEGGGKFVIEPDRRRAIRLAFAEARAGDVVVIAGKGHEPTQTFADRTVPFDDRVVAREELLALGGAR